MRRPLFILFLVSIIISFFITNLLLDKEQESYIIQGRGLVSNKINKSNCTQYRVGDYLVKDFSKKLKINPGEIINFKGKVKSYKFTDEKFNYNKYLKSEGYKGVLEIYKYDIVGDNYIYVNLFEIKDKMIKSIKYLYKDKSKFINSTMLGEKNSLDLDTKEIFSKTGVSHILALSGLHVGILITLIGFSIGKINNIPKFIILSLTLWAYSVIVGNIPSILRAIGFNLIYYFSIFIERRSDSINNLSIIGILLIINNPYVIYNLSFQLSFLATLSIIYFYGYIREIIKFKLISLTISANILTLPLVYLYFKNISIVCILSNIIVVPLLSIIIYMSILSVIILPFSIILTKILVYINTSIISFIFISLETLYDLNGSYIEFKNSNGFFVILYYILIGIFMIYKEIKTIKEQKNGLQGYHQEYEEQRI